MSYVVDYKPLKSNNGLLQIIPYFLSFVAFIGLSVREAFGLRLI